MHEGISSVLAGWSNFYVITGSSAAALTGLMFVVITLAAGDRTRTKTEGISTFSTPTVVHFCATLFVSAILSAPWRSLVHAGVMLAITGLFGVAYALLVVRRARRLTTYRPDAEEWVWYAILPFAAYVAILAGAVGLPAAPAEALFALAGGALLLIFIGIHNAWDVVTYLVINVQPDDPPAP
jgi:hypothetical protein